MKSITARLVSLLALSLMLSLIMGGALYFGAQSLLTNAQQTRAANDNLRELFAFALSAHRYMNAFGQSLGQRTVLVGNERRLAAKAFDDRMQAIPRSRARLGEGENPLDWELLRRISQDLSRELQVADELREQGKFAEAEQLFNRAKKAQFDQRMLPWFEAAIEAQRRETEALEAQAQRQSGTLRGAGTLLPVISALLGALVLFATSRFVIRPTRLLVGGTEAIAKGDLSYRIAYQGQDEMGVLAMRFNEMAEVVEGNRQALLEKNTALEEAYALQSEFLSIVSHELRSPLHSIIGYTELVLDDQSTLPVQTSKNVQSIAAGAQRLLLLINDILDFSKLRAGRMRVRSEPFRLLELASAVLEDARALVRGRSVRVVLECSADPGELCSDESKVRQILTNLLTNAVKFTDRGQVTLELSAEPVDLVVLRVTDTGIGIPEDQREIVFDPFRQARGTDKRAVSGTGLGLAIVKRLVALLGGSVSLDSQLGQGSQFSIRLPRRSKESYGQDPDH